MAVLLLMIYQVNWQPKGLNVLKTASELGISEVRAVVFIDDNPLEITDVQRSCPEASTLLAPEGDDEQYWTHCWALDTFRVTTEDENRAGMMQMELERQQDAHVMTFAGFVESLRLSVTTYLARDAELPRVLQLTQKTNQFNFTTGRLTSLPIGASAIMPCNLGRARSMIVMTLAARIVALQTWSRM